MVVPNIYLMSSCNETKIYFISLPESEVDQNSDWGNLNTIIDRRCERDIERRWLQAMFKVLLFQ